MYVRQCCYLCEQARKQLEELQRRYRFQFGRVVIESAPQLVCESGECVPAATIDGKVRFRGAANRVLLERVLSR